MQFSNWHNDFQRKDMAHLFILVSRTSEDTCSISYTIITQLVFHSSFLAYYSSMLFTSNLILFSSLIPTISFIIHTYVWCIIRQESITIGARNVKFFISIPFIYKLSKAKIQNTLKGLRRQEFLFCVRSTRNKACENITKF